MLFGLPWWAVAGAAAVAVAPRSRAAKIQAKEIKPDRAKKAVTVTLAKIPTEGTGGIKVWGTSVTELDATFRPYYLKTDGKTDLRYGFCATKLADDISKCEGHPAWTRKIDDVVVWIANLVSAGAGTVAKWITDHMCVRFKWKGVRKYKWPGDIQTALGGMEPGVTYYMVDTTTDRKVMPAAPAFPSNLPQRSGYKRVWIQTIAQGASPMTRSDDAVIVYWPASEEGGPRVSELCSRRAIRAMLRMACGQTGSIDPKTASARGHWQIKMVGISEQGQGGGGVPLAPRLRARQTGA